MWKNQPWKILLKCCMACADRYEPTKGSLFSDEALEAAARFSERYVTDRHLPDKAIA